MDNLPLPPKMLPPHWFLLALLAIVMLGWLQPDGPAPARVRWSGLPLVLAGIAMAMAGSRLFARAGTNIVPLTRSTTLVTHGVFAWSRNPMYLGMFLALSGTALLVQAWAAWLVVIAFVALIRQRFVLREEALLRQTFGEAYADYCRTVRRWI